MKKDAELIALITHGLFVLDFAALNHKSRLVIIEKLTELDRALEEG